MKKISQRSGPFLIPTLLICILACVLLAVNNDREILTQKPSVSDPAKLSNEAKNLNVSMEMTSIDVNHLGFRIRVDGWQEGLLVQDVWLQDAGSRKIDLQNIYSTQNAHDSYLEVHYDLIPKVELPAGRFLGQIVLQVGVSSMDTPLAEYRFDLDVKLNPTLHQDVHETVSANGVQALLESVEISSSNTAVVLCYDEPDPGDWIPGQNSKIETANVTVRQQGFRLLSEADTGYSGESDEPSWVAPVFYGRCGKLQFPLGRESITGTSTLTIEEFEQSSSFISPSTDIQKAREDLKQQGIEIEIIFVSEPEGSGNTWNILQKPEHMDYSEAIRLVRNAMGLYFHGPWSFTFMIDQ